MTQEPSLNTQDSDSVSRREIGKKAAYVIPAVLAIIAAADRPALAQSLPG